MEKQPEVKDDLTAEVPRRYHKNKRKHAIHKIMNIIGNILIGVLAAAILLFLVIIVKGMASNGQPEIFGHQLYIVRSNSMSPTFETGSLNIVKRIDPEFIRVDDIITYQRNGEGISTTHRVVEIQQEEPLQFITRGDANNTNDPLPVEANAVIGKVVISIPYAGFVLGFAKSKKGMSVLLIIPGILLIISQVKQLLRYSKEKKQISEKSNSVIKPN